MNKVLQGLVILPGLLFFTMGIRWMVDPAGIAPQFGFELSEGIGLSSQIGDMSGYFLAMSICMFLGVYTSHRTWFYPPIMLLLLTAVGRVIAWAVHGAAFATPMIAVEVIVSTILIVASIRLPKAAKAELNQP